MRKHNAGRVARPVTRSHISKGTRTFVLERDGFTCQMCGASHGEPHPDDDGRPTRLQVGRIVLKCMGGSDEHSNLRAVCSVCNDGARNLILDRPSLQKLLIQVRRATGADQMGVLHWLVRRFPEYAEKLLQKDASIS